MHDVWESNSCSQKLIINRERRIAFLQMLIIDKNHKTKFQPQHANTFIKDNIQEKQTTQKSLYNKSKRTATVRAEVNDNSGHISIGRQLYLPPVVRGGVRVCAVWGVEVIGVRHTVTGSVCFTLARNSRCRLNRRTAICSHHCT